MQSHFDVSCSCLWRGRSWRGLRCQSSYFTACELFSITSSNMLSAARHFHYLLRLIDRMFGRFVASPVEGALNEARQVEIL